MAVTPRVFCAVSAVMTRQAVSAERRERLQVGLDARAAAGIGAGDGEDVGDRMGHGRSERIGASNCRAAQIAGSAAVHIADTTAIPPGPARITSAALCNWIPPIATVGSWSAHTSRRARRYRTPPTRPAWSAYRIPVPRRHNRSMPPSVLASIDLRVIRYRQPDQRPRPKQRPCDIRPANPLADMHAVGTGRERDIHMVVDDERHARPRASAAASRARGRATRVCAIQARAVARSSTPPSSAARVTSSARVMAAALNRIEDKIQREIEQPGMSSPRRRAHATRASRRTGLHRAMPAGRDTRPRNCRATRRRVTASSPAMVE